jgi:mono/diheme cytochrome c family protein
MPSFQESLSDEDVTDILAYIKTGWQPDQREIQAEITSNWKNSQ